MSLLARDRRRVLIAAGAEPLKQLLALFERDPLAMWETRTADTFSAARFMLQHTPCDLLLVHESLYQREGAQGLAWLAFQREAPVLFLGSTAAQFTRAYELGTALCLPSEMALSHPPLLHESMKQTLHQGALRHLHERTHDQLIETRRHVDRLVNMIWRITPYEPENQWLPQRHLLERLDEELARSLRHRAPLSVAVGEFNAGHDAEMAKALPEGTAELIMRSKRRCDVVGQYGPRGFLLLMVHTPKRGSVQCCRRLQQFLDDPAEMILMPQPAQRTCFGLASASPEIDTPQALLGAAEKNLDAARRAHVDWIVA